MRVRSALAVLFLYLLCLPAFASSKCLDPIQSLAASDAQTGTPVTITWSLGGLIPKSITLTGHDFEQPVILAPDQLTYSYVPDMPGEKQVTLTVVTDCGTFSLTRKYHVQQCNVVTPPLHIDKTSVAPGEVINASIELLPGHSARWVVQNGTASATSGASIQVIAGASGSVSIDVYIARGSSCEVTTGAVVPIVPPCAIAEPQIVSNSNPAPDSGFGMFVLNLPADETVSFVVHGATVLFRDATQVFVRTPSSGSFSIDVVVANGTCSRTFTRTFEVTPCAPAVVVSGGSGSCDKGVLIADFTGTAPFQGSWSDGEFFFTNESHLERTVTTSGVYTISYFFDARCRGTVSGSAQVGASVSNPAFAIDDIVGGFYYGVDSCPNMQRTATLSVPIPPGFEPVWSVDNGTILSGQGTAALQFAGRNPGWTAVHVLFRSAEGCTSQTATQSLFTNGAPEIAVSVEPSTIGAGGTAIVTFTRLNDFVRGSSVESSLGDPIVFRGSSGNTIQYEYRSTNGGGAATITASANNSCGQSVTATTTLNIDGGAPVGAKATVRALGTSCQDYLALAELTGVAPFSGRWSNGETFYSPDYPYAYLRPPTGGTYTLVEFNDANGPGTVTGAATFDFIGLPQPEVAFSAPAACPNAAVTATLTNGLPEGGSANWFVGSGGTIVSGQGTSSVQIQTDGYGVNLYVQVSAPGACSPGTSAYLPGSGPFVQQPQFTLYGVYAGSSTDFFVMLDPATATWGFENTLGDAMEIVDSPWPNAYIVRYSSSHGAGESTVRIYGTTQCGTSFEATQVMTVLAPPPSITLTSTPGASCGAVVTATFSGGTAPYTIWWSDTGTTETTSESTITHIVNYTQYVYATVTDANGASGGSNWIYAEATLLPYVPFSMQTQICLGGQATFEAQPLEGAEILWTIEGPNLRIVSGQGTSRLVVEGVEPGNVHVNVRYRTLDGCDGLGSGANVEVSSAYCP
jgi:hypothetical protein